MKKIPLKLKKKLRKRKEGADFFHFFVNAMTVRDDFLRTLQICSFFIHEPRAKGATVTQPPISELLVEVCL